MASRTTGKGNGTVACHWAVPMGWRSSNDVGLFSAAPWVRQSVRLHMLVGTRCPIRFAETPAPRRCETLLLCCNKNGRLLLLEHFHRSDRNLWWVFHVFILEQM